MQIERWQQIDQLFHLALEREPAERALFLEQACSGDESLRSEVAALISSHEEGESFIETPAADLAAALLSKNHAGLEAGQSVGHYEIAGVLGMGGMGEVYLAQDFKLGRRVALKLLPARFTVNVERVHRFEQEARAVSALNHPNIVTIHEIGREGDAQFIVTEFVDGQTLRQRLSESAATPRLALDVAIQVAGALEAAHAAGIVHRDIKPENIMLRTDGYVKVLDFGLAKLTEQSASLDVAGQTLMKIQTRSGLVMGTATYMSPEQARGLDVDARSDIFSLGIVIYEMLAGRVPFDGATTSDVIVSILEKEPQPLRQYSPDAPIELEWMIKKALAKDREERYQTIKDFQIDLKRLKQELEIQAKLDGRTPSSWRATSRATLSSVNTTADELTNNSAPSMAHLSSGAETAVENKSSKRLAWPGKRTFLFAAVALAVFSAASFYAGLTQAPAPARPTFRQLTFRRGAITGARFAPDGGTLIYSAAFDGKPVELFTSHLESPESSSLKLQANIESISSTGEMAILLDCEVDMFGCRNGTLARLPLVGGTPREVMEHIDHADWGPDGLELAVVRANDEGQYQLEYPIGTVLYKAAGNIGDLSVAPQGDLVAFVDQPVLGDASGSVLVVNRNGQVTTLSSGWKSVGGIAWTPTGEEIWFSAGKTKVNALFAVSRAGRERLVFQAPGNIGLRDISKSGRVLLQRGVPRSRMIVSTPELQQEHDLAWFDFSTSADISADGKNLLFYEAGAAVGGGYFVYLRRMDGSTDPIRLGEGKALALSPDGKWALAVQENPTPQLVLLPTGPGQPRLLPRGNIKEYHFASWFPDGQRFLVTGLEPDHALRSYVQDVSGGPPQPITPELTLAISVSPDGKRLIKWTPSSSSPEGQYSVSLIDGKASRPIPGLEFGERPIQWSTDGQALYVAGSGEFRTGLYRIDLSNGHRQLRKEIVPDQVGFVMLEIEPGGMRITPDGKSYVYTYWTALRDIFLAEGLK
ncbi:MAG: WD40 repeat domain-containing serine/threonine protein kinase [bacterium]